MLNLEKIGKKISNRRKELNITQSGLADKLFVTHQAVSKWENGKSIPSIELLYDLTQVLDVSIDYLLKDVEVTDYETLLKQTSREKVLQAFLHSEDPNNDIEEIFYLLDSKERRILIDTIISGTLAVTIERIWHLLSKKERFYLIGVITSNKFDYDLNRIKTQLSVSEKAIINNQTLNGPYQYYLNKYYKEWYSEPKKRKKHEIPIWNRLLFIKKFNLSRM